MTATTPSMRAVRFETGLIELELSNRIQCKTQPGGSSSYLKLFGKCQVDLNLALGQIVRHQVQISSILIWLASLFKYGRLIASHFSSRCMKKQAQTSIRWHTLERALVCEMLCRKRSVALQTRRLSLSHLTDQLFLPSQWHLTEVWFLFDSHIWHMKVDIVDNLDLYSVSAVLFWLNYKAAYDNWNEQRMALNKDIHVATKEVVDKLPGIQQTSAQAFSTLFLQLTVNDLGICLPITITSQVSYPALSWLLPFIY